jgi:hypothetical protein
MALIATVSTASLSYYVASQPSQTQNFPSPTSTPTPIPTLTPTPTPTSTPIPTPSPTPTSSEKTVIYKPSVPEFTIKIVDNSYDVPVTYTYEIDRFTGEERRISHGGYHVENKSIVFTIKNQPFTSYTTSDRNVTVLAYEVRVKGHFEEDWTIEGYIDSSDGEYTTKSYALGENSEIYMLRSAASGGQVDFQVQTLMGYFYDVYDYNTHSGLFYLYFPPEAYFAGEKSDWSSTQTINQIP